MNQSVRSSHDTRSAAARPFNTHMHRVIEPVLALPSGSAVLDIGCGDGAVGRWLAGRGRHHVLGIDLDLPDRAATGGRRPLPDGGSLELRKADLADIPQQRRYDGVLLLGVLHYAGSADGVRRMLAAADALGTPDAPLALSWICDEVPLTYEEAYLPGRGLVEAVLADLGRTATTAWSREVTHAHGGSPEHDHRIVYGSWQRP
ncbi:bifunctional 2-polyprenyl-6-hydroxyphenol methylase/3-demethylubiquinol 3-O-methyltransferase UbiG [Streptacidiphilus sp. P02-A3a]|uniref:class I SAM-dependent methyltransferase n=1 Tax=Streptacidiphilus sp. P02-A3a TaxID=2704468 RepID=UPI0015F85635|nr:class I SAM-dependent methyltransferase [Streptacidiphilus sp. P02-A3a]QMU71546.1 class I SAM-dependent methyltransferase [Streptacidiphilus sp. P02-A3a]